MTIENFSTETSTTHPHVQSVKGFTTKFFLQIFLNSVINLQNFSHSKLFTYTVSIIIVVTLNLHDNNPVHKQAHDAKNSHSPRTSSDNNNFLMGFHKWLHWVYQFDSKLYHLKQKCEHIV